MLMIQTIVFIYECDNSFGIQNINIKRLSNIDIECYELCIGSTIWELNCDHCTWNMYLISLWNKLISIISHTVYKTVPTHIEYPWDLVRAMLSLLNSSCRILWLLFPIFCSDVWFLVFFCICFVGVCVCFS